LHALILEKRQLGSQISEKWIRRFARLEFESLWPERVTILEKRKVFSGMAFSNGWFTGFLKRKYLSLRASTEKAQVVPADYKDKITSWLQFNQRAQARFNFELSEIANMDQTPPSFEFLNNKTYNTTGARTVFLKQTGSGWDRRQAFVQVELGLPIDGSRDYEIKIKDFPDVQIGNWKDWQPKEAGHRERIYRVI
jgi:hypothetical protein